MTITITQPDDWHVHVRDGEMLARVIPYTAAQFGRALIMPNLDPPVSTVQQALEYRKTILSALPEGASFDPKMSLYLTDDTTEAEVEAAAQCEHILGFKLYPAGATTNSSSGVTRVSSMMNVFESMARHSVVLQVHGEVTDPHVDIFDRESVFIDQILFPLHHELPDLGLVLEHVTTSQGVDFVKATNPFVAGTITPHHLMYNRNEMFRDGIRPHNYCLPVLKREPHRQSLVAAATSGDPSFFLGTDSAPHIRSNKQSACGCAGIFSAHAAIEFYAEVFAGLECIDKLENFASHFGADFYKLERNPRKITLNNKTKHIPASIRKYQGADAEASDDDIIPLMAGETLAWSLSGTPDQ
ncbi:dihydroorotase [Candidatus Spongiihabitans sp.]|uniref:dihydroorotase n=1 Tax=Candidatus Spongiihabitans sp. TaxID=3101308 RepID=UPI003C6F7A38